MKRPVKSEIPIALQHLKDVFLLDVIRNNTINEWEEFLPSEEEIKDILIEWRPGNSTWETVCNDLAQAIHKRLMGE